MSYRNSGSVLTPFELNSLEKRKADDYIVAFGPNGRQLIGTPNGYSATQLPSRVLHEMCHQDTKKVIWASFGDLPESWFFSYELRNGKTVSLLGIDVPRVVYECIDDIRKLGTSPEALHVQLGSGGSFLIWNQSAWVCFNIPDTLLNQLYRLSNVTTEFRGVTRGWLKQGTCTNVQWHKDGSYYLRSVEGDSWKYRSGIMQDAWVKLWQGTKNEFQGHETLSDLAYVAVDSYAPSSETFAFFKKEKSGNAAPFILRFGDEPIYARLAPENLDLQNVEPKPDNTHVKWAISKKKGRPHKDTWELELKKGERVKILSDKGREWYIGVNQKGVKGWIHGSWLDFSDNRVTKDFRSAWNRFNKDLGKLFDSGPLRAFPSMAQYVDVCTKAECKSCKEDSSLLGICVHDLQVLLEGSGSYSSEWIKEVRNRFHPDRFARYCMPEHVVHVRSRAEHLFVLCGLLMESV
ncbi:hypothetical protein GQ44DRAFT_313788 [Phaeosphaeriaceae sp. PMI808]|nr:hypothetical protein GQ44DRAFT_313788 [Phaeosphaeriaceae sp. PMI808]